MKSHRRATRVGCTVALALVATACFGCGDSTGPAAPGTNGIAAFEVAWSAVDSQYPFFAFKKIDWDRIYSAYRPRAERATGQAVDVVLLEMLGELKDGHVWLRPPAGSDISLHPGWVTEPEGRIWPYYPPRKARDQDVWDTSLLFNYLDPLSIQVTEDSAVGWATVNGDIGYIYLSEFMPHEITASLHAAVDGVRQTRALIVDVRHNTGGHRPVIEAFVSRFLTQPQAGLTAYLLGEPLPAPPVRPGGSFQYTNPIVVLINGVSFSGAEAFAEMMRQLPHVTVMGDTTGGGSGGADNRAPGVVRLPNGAEVGFPTVDLRRYDGMPWEWLGIPPDIRVRQTRADLANGRDMQLEAAIELLR